MCSSAEYTHIQDELSVAPKLLVNMPGLQGSLVCEQDELCEGPSRSGVHRAGGRDSSPGGPPRGGAELVCHFSPNTHQITKSSRSMLPGRRGGFAALMLQVGKWDLGVCSWR